MVDEELDADLLEDLETGEELEEDLDEELEADEDETSACAPTWRARCRVLDHGHRE